MTPHLDIDVRSEADRRVVAARGEIDLENSPRLWETIRDELTSSKTPVWIDLSGVDYMDSSGIAVLVQGHKHAARSRREFGLLRPSAKVRNLIELAQLHRLFTIEPASADEERSGG